MSGRRADMWDIREILRRVRLGESDRAIVKAVGVSRKTVRKYREWAAQAGLPAGELPPCRDRCYKSAKHRVKKSPERRIKCTLLIPIRRYNYATQGGLDHD